MPQTSLTLSDTAFLKCAATFIRVTIFFPPKKIFIPSSVTQLIQLRFSLRAIVKKNTASPSSIYPIILLRQKITSYTIITEPVMTGDLERKIWIVLLHLPCSKLQVSIIFILLENLGWISFFVIATFFRIKLLAFFYLSTLIIYWQNPMKSSQCGDIYVLIDFVLHWVIVYHLFSLLIFSFGFWIIGYIPHSPNLKLFLFCLKPIIRLKKHLCDILFQKTKQNTLIAALSILSPAKLLQILSFHLSFYCLKFFFKKYLDQGFFVFFNNIPWHQKGLSTLKSRNGAACEVFFG